MDIPRYITQIKSEWLRRVSRRIIPGNGMKIKEDTDSVTVEADIDSLKLQIEGGGGGSGTVQTVDGKSPDESGAVSFGLTAGRLVKTDANGHLASLGALSGSKWMKTDENGLPSTTTDSPATLADSGTPSNCSTSAGSLGTSDKAARADHVHKIPTTVITTSDIAKTRLTSLGNGVSGTITYVSGVTWDGTTLAFKTKTLTVTNGVITAIGAAEASTTIDIPVVYNPT